MAQHLSPTTLVGSTGLVGSQVLSALIALSPAPSSILSITRRSLTVRNAAVNSVVEQDSSKWPEIFKKLEPTQKIFISALATTRGQAGSFEAQRTIDVDLNLSLARSARECGATIYVLISTAQASAKSFFPYMKMKGDLEDAVKELGFPYTVIVRPGLLVGNRTDSRPPEAFFRFFAKGLGVISKNWLTDWWAQDVDVIGRAVVAAVLQCDQSKRQPGLWIVEQQDIIKFGKTDWKA